MEFHDIINAIVHNFRRGTYGFFIDTDFGRLAVEQLTEDFDEMDPTTVIPWEEAPATNLYLANRHASADYWLGIGNAHKDTFPMRVHVIEALVKVMFLSILGTIPDEDIIDAGVSVYLTEAEHKNPNINMMTEEFLRMNIDIIPRQYSSVRMMAEKLIRTRFMAAQRVVAASKDLLSARGVWQYAGRFQSGYYIDLFGVLLYAIQRDPTLSINIGRERFYGIIFREEYRIYGDPEIII